MKSWVVTVWASEKIEVEAETKDEAEALAVEQSQFPWADYCDAEEAEE